MDEQWLVTQKFPSGYAKVVDVVDATPGETFADVAARCSRIYPVEVFQFTPMSSIYRIAVQSAQPASEY